MTNTERAAAAERAVLGRHWGKLWGIPGTALARTTWPPDARDRRNKVWHYWWQAHLLDCLVDAQLRSPESTRAAEIKRLSRGIHLRNARRWTNAYYDDMAWLGLALHRAHAVTGLRVDGALTAITVQLHAAWSPEGGGGIWWRKTDVENGYKNAPANGPAAIFHARTGYDKRAAELVDWLTERLVDPDEHLVWDGLRVAKATGEVVDTVKRLYTYCQGVYLGACLETGRHELIERTVDAVQRRLAPNGVLRGHGGGDGGLFSGILTRYLALVARELPGTKAASIARELVVDAAEACWSNSVDAEHGPLFGPDWSKPASLPVDGDDKAPSRDLSVQLGGWMALEAAAAL